MKIFLCLLAFLLFSGSSKAISANFEEGLNTGDVQFLEFLLQSLPSVVLSKNPESATNLRAKLKELILAERLRQRPSLQQAFSSNYWVQSTSGTKWMIDSSLSMIERLRNTKHWNDELARQKNFLLEKTALLAKTESTLDVTAPKNLAAIAAVIQQVQQKDASSGLKISEIYLNVRKVYVPLELPAVFNGTPVTHELLPQVNHARWDDTMSEVLRRIRESKAGSSLPVSLQPSFEKSILDIFFAYKFPLLDMKFREVFHPKAPGLVQPDPESAEALGSLRSLERVLQLTGLFASVDLEGGGRQFVKNFQPKVEPVPAICERFAPLAKFSPTQWKQIRQSRQVAIIDPGHLGGEFTDDNREISPPGEKGKESYGYREGFDAFLIGNLARSLLVHCAGLGEHDILLSRRGLHDEGGKFFNKEGDLLEGHPNKKLRSSDNLFFRKALLGMAKPNLVISIHTDYSDTFTQHGMVILPRHPLSVGGGFYKSHSQYRASLGLAETVRKSLTESMYSNPSIKNRKSANDWLRFEFKDYFLREMDLQIFRDLQDVPVVLVEGYDYADPRIRELMNSVVRGHRIGDPEVKQINIDGTDYSFHTIHQSYAEGVALGALRYMLGVL